MITKAGGAKIRFHLPCNFDDVVAVSFCKFYNEYGPRITLNKKTIFALLNIIFCTLKNVMIDQFMELQKRLLDSCALIFDGRPPRQHTSEITVDLCSQRCVGNRVPDGCSKSLLLWNSRGAVLSGRSSRLCNRLG